MDYKKKYIEIKALKPKSRGFAFEKLINEIFDDCKVLIDDSYKTADLGQQIDGAIEINGRIFILEAKWEKKETLAASKLYSFLGKINSKLDGTLGVFISHNRLKDNFVKAIRDGLKQNCILIHGEENIIDIVDGKVKLNEFVWYCYKEASTKNKSEFNTSEFLSLPKAVIKIDEDIKTSQARDNWDSIYRNLIDATTSAVFEQEVNIKYVTSHDLPSKIINVLPTLTYSRLISEKAKKLVEKSHELEKIAFEKVLIEKFKGDYFNKYAKSFIIDVLPKRIFVSDANCKAIIENVTKNFDGDWEIENESSRILDLIFDCFNIDNLKLVAKKYLDIYLDSSRQDRFEQKQFANKVFSKLEVDGVNLYETFKDDIFEYTKSLKKFEKIWLVHGIGQTETLKETVIGRVLSRFSKIVNPKSEDKIKQEVESYYETL